MFTLFRLFALNFLIFIPLVLFSQEVEKIEFEKRVTKDQFPEQIIQELGEYLENSRRIRFFQEFDGIQYTWEIKMVFNRISFSIEYNPDLTLLDIEVLENWRRLSPLVKEPLAVYFNQHYVRYKIRRVQQQFLPQPGRDQNEFIASILKGPMPPAQAYELEAEVKGINNNEFGSFEFLFDKDFQLKEKRKIIPLSDVNLHF
ncbi:MAG TPA: hypothetical protein VLH61_01950 [Bacteroidales bacterium]|nr:hypothetical protein [Bacteroidales bacterium]